MASKEIDLELAKEAYQRIQEYKRMERLANFFVVPATLVFLLSSALIGTLTLLLVPSMFVYRYIKQAFKPKNN